MSQLFNFDVSVVFHFVVVVAVGGDHNVSGGVGLNFFRRFSILKRILSNMLLSIPGNWHDLVKAVLPTGSDSLKNRPICIILSLFKGDLYV